MKQYDMMIMGLNLAMYYDIMRYGVIQANKLILADVK